MSDIRRVDLPRDTAHGGCGCAKTYGKTMPAERMSDIGADVRYKAGRCTRWLLRHVFYCAKPRLLERTIPLRHCVRNILRNLRNERLPMFFYEVMDEIVKGRTFWVQDKCRGLSLCAEMHYANLVIIDSKPIAL